MVYIHSAESISDLESRPLDYSTESLDLAAWLVCQGFPLHRIDPPSRSNPKPHASFVFPESEDLSEAVSTWESGQPILGTDLRRYISVKRDLYGRARSVVSHKAGDLPTNPAEERRQS